MATNWGPGVQISGRCLCSLSNQHSTTACFLLSCWGGSALDGIMSWWRNSRSRCMRCLVRPLPTERRTLLDSEKVTGLWLRGERPSTVVGWAGVLALLPAKASVRFQSKGFFLFCFVFLSLLVSKFSLSFHPALLANLNVCSNVSLLVFIFL